MVALIVLGCNENTEPIVAPVFTIKGMDGSFIPELREQNIAFYNIEKQEEDIVSILKKSGVNTVRLRLWYSPASNSSSLKEVKNFATELHQKGLKVWLCIHYSDTWADPGNQQKPKAWENISGNTLVDSVFNYTFRVVQQIEPEIVQIGNEINGGFLWPDGKANLQLFNSLIKSGLQASKLANPSTERMIHIAGSDKAYTFFSELGTSDYELIGISHYPWWHGNDLEALRKNADYLGNTFNKKVVIAETAYPFTLNYNDDQHNVVGLANQLHPDFEASHNGQLTYLQAIAQLSTENITGYGFCYWGGEWVAYKGSVFTDGSSWENMALFDFNHKALPSLAAFNP